MRHTEIPWSGSSFDGREKLTLFCGILLLALVGFTACPASGEPPPCVTNLEAGEPAPFTGDLCPVATMIRLGLRIEGAIERHAEALKHQGEIFGVKLQAAEDRAETRVDAANARAAIFKAKVQALSVWYRSPYFVAAVSAGLTLLAVTVVGYTWGQLSRLQVIGG